MSALRRLVRRCVERVDLRLATANGFIESAGGRS
jgi:hypothetical protein